MPDLQPGTVFAGHRIEGIAGRGGMGTVYRATHIALDHVVALKVISADLAADDAFRERFRSESRIAVSLRHANVVPIHHAGEEDGLLFVTMDLVDGPDLRRMLIASGTLPPDRAIKIIGQVASALDVAHSRGLVHRDIKPGNILVERDSDDRAFLTDFGLAKRFDQATEAGALTRTGAFVGTLDYVAPEQIRGDRVDARTDVYALGCVLYEAISGRAPFADREENVAKIYAHLQDEPPWLPGDGGNEGELDEVIARALAKEPADRYPSAGDLARAAAAAIEGHEVLRSAERSVATGKAAPETGEPATPPLPIPDTVESEVAAGGGTEEAPQPEETQPLSAVAETTAEHPGPTRVAGASGEATAASPRPATSPSAKRSGGPRWSRIGIALGIVAAIVVAGVVLLGGGGDNDVGSIGGAGFAEPKLVGEPIAVDGVPVGIAVADGTVAVATRSGERVRLFDEGSGQSTGEVVLPAPGENVTIADDSFWATVPTADTVVRAPVGGGEAKEIAVGDGPMGVTFDGSSIWVANSAGPSISAIDPTDDSVSEPVTLQGASFPSQIAAGEGRLWVVDRENALLISAEPGDPSVQEDSPLGSKPKGVVTGAGSVWAANTGNGKVVEFSPTGGELDEIQVGGEPRLLAYGFGRIWVADGNGAVEAIDPADNSVQRVAVEGSPEGVAIGKDRVWVTTGEGDEVVRLDPGVAKG